MSSERHAFHRLDALPKKPARQEIIHGLVATGEIVALVGAPSAGKSAVGVLAAISVATGSSFLGRVTEVGTVVYVAAERRLEAERRLLSAASGTPPIYISGLRPAVADPKEVRDLINTLREIETLERDPIRLILFDTAAKCLRGLDENSARDIGLAVEGLTRIGEAIPSAAVMLVHHTDKSGRGMRGSSALLGAVDVELTVTGTSRRRIEVTKANSVPEEQLLEFRLEERPCFDGCSVIAAVPVEPVSDPPSEERPKRLNRDAVTALKCLEGLGGASDLAAWKAAVYAAFGERKTTAKNQAFSKAKQRLQDLKLVSISGDLVSVSGS